MEVLKFLGLYWMIAGIICITGFNLILKSDNEELNESLSTMSWQTGIHRNKLIYLIDLILLLLGGIFLLILFKIKRKTNENNLTQKDINNKKDM